MASSRDQKEWYQKGIGAVAALLILPLFAVWYVWKKTAWPKWAKVTSTVVIATLFIVILTGMTTGSQSNNPTVSGGNKSTQPSEQDIAAQKTKDDAQKAADKKVADNLVVSSSIVKKTNNRFRYFFNVKNNNVQAFSGKVTITLISEDQTFKSPFDMDLTDLQPGTNNYSYIELHTGNTAQFGLSGLSTYAYKVRVGANEFEYPGGPITNQFEDLDAAKAK